VEKGREEWIVVRSKDVKVRCVKGENQRRLSALYLERRSRMKD
jgi:hypothetical protein